MRLRCDKYSVIPPHPLDQVMSGYQTLSISSIVRNAQSNVCTPYPLNAGHVLAPAPYARILVVHRKFVPTMPLILEPFPILKAIFHASTENLRTPGQKERLRNIGPHRLSSCAASPRLTRKSRVVSNASQLLAMLGATLRRLGTRPLYSPRRPSWLTIVLTASGIDLY